MIRTMTSGSPVRLLVSFALPVLMGGIVQKGYTLVDAAIISWAVGEEAFAAIGAVSNIDGLIIGFGMMLIQGFSILIAQQYGAATQSTAAQRSAGQSATLRRTIAHAFSLTFLSGALLTAGSLLCLHPFLRVLNTPAEIYTQAWQYIVVIQGGMLVPMLTHMAFATLRALGDGKTQFWALILSSLLNIALDWLCVVVLSWGVAGAAIATIVAQLLLWPWIVHRLMRVPILRLHRVDFRPDRPTATRLMQLSLPLAMQNSIALIGVLLLQASVNLLGVAAIAAFNAAMRIFFFMKEPAIAMEHALNTFVGQNTGAQLPGRVRQGVRQGIGVMLVVCAAAMVIMFAFTRPLVGIVLANGEAETIRLASLLLRIFALMLPILYLMYVYRSTLQGMGRTNVIMVSGVVEMVLRSVLALTLPGRWGFVGVGIAETSAWAGAAALFIIVYYRIRISPGDASVQGP